VTVISNESSSLLIREARPDDRDALLNLLAANGWSPSRLKEWAATATVLELYDPAFLVPRGAAIVRSTGAATFDLLAWATDLDVDSAEVAERLVRAISDVLRRHGGERVYVPVSGSAPERLAPLIAVGFRPAGIPPGEVDVQDPGVGGLVWLDKEL
jgi:hypothetical protein